VPADIVFVVKDKPHQHFKREGPDVKYVCKVGLKEALCGGVVEIPTLDKATVPLPLTDVVKPTTIKRISGQGLPIPKIPGKRGDLVIEFDIRFPDSLPAPVKDVLRDALPVTTAV